MVGCRREGYQMELLLNLWTVWIVMQDKIDLEARNIFRCQEWYQAHTFNPVLGSLRQDCCKL